MSEKDLINWLRERLAKQPKSVLVGSGPDDCAIVDSSGIERLAITTDTILEGTHFSPDDSPEDIGWKAVAVNLSDLAASGCKPLWGVIGVGLQRGKGSAWAKKLAEGMFEAAEKYGLAITGGDTTSGTGPTSICVTVIGTPYGKAPLLRSGAKPGDVIAVTGHLGGSISGRHLRPIPRLLEIEKILEIANINACMDISDGVSLDLSRMMNESKCGALILEKLIPVSDDAQKLSASDGMPAVKHALNDGEDFELLFTIAEDSWSTLSGKWRECGYETAITRIGSVTEDTDILIELPDGSKTKLSPEGYLHEF
ncbi:MAG: thiamine-monophosphate kinase [Planctomycetes bacterium]|nr:thiamine-monophosphate kinase [Planctomycetota bacterium]